MIIPLQPTALLLLDGLANGLYENWAACLYEIIRNGANACMEPNKWQPERVDIRIWLERHPLCEAGHNAMIALDLGRGLTSLDLKRYCSSLGTPTHEIRAAMGGNGVAQKGLGRFAALALVRGCIEGDIAERIRHGYYVFSRTATSGPVRKLTVFPEYIEGNHGFDADCFVQSDDRELGSMKNMTGSFTAIVMPNPVFANEAEIREAIKWYLPRDRSRMYKSLMVGKQLMQPPPLEQTVNIVWQTDQRYHAHLGAGTVTSGGVRLCDSDTGLPVATFADLAARVPEILSSPELCGDVFVPGVLANQDTSRRTLVSSFMKRSHKPWARILAFLISQVAPAASNLIEADVISGEAADALGDVVDMIKLSYGEPEPDKEPDPPKDPPGPKEPREPATPPNTHPEEKAKRKRCIRILIDGEEFTLYRALTMDKHILVQPQPLDPRKLMVNVGGEFASFPRQAAARREVFLLAIMRAVAESRFPSDPYKAQQTMYQLCQKARQGPAKN